MAFSIYLPLDKVLANNHTPAGSRMQEMVLYKTNEFSMAGDWIGLSGSDRNRALSVAATGRR
jgi:hypothetical protein